MDKYKILEINTDDGWVRIEVTFADGEVYEKKMMADTSTKDGITGSIEGWLSQYLIDRAAIVQENVSSLVNKTIDFIPAEPPAEEVA